MTALLVYQELLLLRSQRWLPPVLLYAAFLAVGVQAGGPVLDALGWAAAGLLPATAWLVRVCATQEPAAARHVTAAAAGPEGGGGRRVEGEQAEVGVRGEFVQVDGAVD
ncbi:hypothetical protein AB0957_22925, partial [Streptomyces zhihengii]